MVSFNKKAEPPKRPMWSGRINIGLVNVPVKLYTMVRDKTFSFRFLRKGDSCPLGYQRVCTLDNKIVDWGDVARGYEVRENEFVVFSKEELDALRPEADERIRIDKFVHFLSVDPIYFDETYILAPDKSEDAYSLFLAALKKLGMAGAGKFTLRNKERPVLVHEYRDSLVLTTLHYAYEVVDPLDLEDVKELKQPDENELNLAVKVIQNLTGEFEITEYRDMFAERVDAMVKKKLKGESIVVERPKKEEVKELMAALQETLKQLEKK
jgi:DNA end-binding protein Ku